jgi:hypothetical protein
MSEHPITKRFRAWLSSVADQLGCGVIDPGNLKHRCEFSFGHDGKHDFEKDSLPQIRIRVRDQPISKADRVGSWTKLNGTWCVRIAGGFQPGDVVRVRNKNGEVLPVVLGEYFGKNTFAFAGRIYDDEERKLLTGRATIEHAPVDLQVLRAPFRFH